MSRGNFVPKNETLMSSKLHQLLPDLKQNNKKKAAGRTLPPLLKIGEDGVNHINIWDQGKTDLGKLLAHGTALGFRHHLFNKFATMEGFWNYIRSEERDDRLRKLVGRPLRNCIRELTFQNIPNFKAIIMDANWQKVQQYPVLRDAVKNSVLPFDCYFMYRRQDGVAERPQYAFWLIEGFNEIRQAVQEEREPNFEFLKDRKNAGIYDSVTPQKKEVAAEKFSDDDKNELASLLRTVCQPATAAEPACEEIPAEETGTVNDQTDTQALSETAQQPETI